MHTLILFAVYLFLTAYNDLIQDATQKEGFHFIYLTYPGLGIQLQNLAFTRLHYTKPSFGEVNKRR